MGQNDGHGSFLGKKVEAVEQEGKIGSRLGSQAIALALPRQSGPIDFPHQKAKISISIVPAGKDP
jgi:hypothetical protein